MDSLKNAITRPNMVVHICNPSYFEGQDREDYNLKLILAKS
jgi:hypothetical protein